MQAAQHKTLFLAAVLILSIQPLAAHTHVVQNSRLGLDTFKTSLHQEIELGSSLKALEIDASVRRTCVRSRSTGKERDAETGLDYMDFRYYGGAQGRFMSPDPFMASANVADPQSWNRSRTARSSGSKARPRECACFSNSAQSRLRFSCRSTAVEGMTPSMR